METPLIIYERPRLRNPYLVIGWTDAGFVGISAIAYLIDKLEAEEFGEIEPQDFSLLPDSVINGGVLEDIEYPESSFYYWKNKKSTNDLIIFGRKPPDVNHHELANLILDVAELFRVKRIYTVGGIFASIAHTEKPRVFAVINHPKLKKYLTHYDVELGTDYHGPTSMNGLLLGFAKERNIEGISLWGRVPSYIGEIPNPKVCETVLRILTSMLDIDIDFSDIESEARHANKQIEEIVSYIRRENPDLDRHIGKLEKSKSIEASEENRQKFFKDIEEFLKKQKGGRENNQV